MPWVPEKHDGRLAETIVREEAEWAASMREPGIRSFGSGVCSICGCNVAVPPEQVEEKTHTCIMCVKNRKEDKENG